jgi:putative photosynthetic complex assembly protein
MTVVRTASDSISRSPLTARPKVEGWPLALVGAAMLGSLVFTGWHQFEKARAPEPAPVVGVLDSRQLVFRDARDGSVEVIDATTREALEPIVGEAGFARGVLRGLAQARLRQGGAPADPFELRAESSGTLRLTDPVTGRTVDLTVFGPANAAVFQAYLNIRQASSPENRR